MTHPISNQRPQQFLAPVGLHDKLQAQHHRIREGVQAGQLTQEEVLQIKEERKELKEMIKEYRSDGRISQEERPLIRAAIKAVAQNISELLHNDEIRSLDNPPSLPPSPAPGVEDSEPGTEDSGSVVDTTA